MKKQITVSALAVLTAGLTAAGVVPALAAGSTALPPSAGAVASAPDYPISDSHTTIVALEGVPTETDGATRSISSDVASPVLRVLTSHVGTLTVTDADGSVLCTAEVQPLVANECTLENVTSGVRTVTAEVVTETGARTFADEVELTAYAAAPVITGARVVDGDVVVSGTTYPDSTVEVGGAEDDATVQVRSDSDGAFTATLTGSQHEIVTAAVLRTVPQDWDRGSHFGRSVSVNVAVEADAAGPAPVVAQPTPGDADPGFTAPVVAQPTPGEVDAGFTAPVVDDPETDPEEEAGSADAPELTGAEWDAAGQVVRATFTGAADSEVPIRFADRHETLLFDEDGHAVLEERLSARFRWQIEVDGPDGGSVVLGDPEAPLVAPGGRAAAMVRPSILPLRDVYVAGGNGPVTILDAEGTELEQGVSSSDGLLAIRVNDAPEGPLEVRFGDGSSITLDDVAYVPPVAPEPIDEGTIEVAAATWDAKGEKATLALRGEADTRATVHVGNDEYTAVFRSDGTDSLTVRASSRFRWAVSVDDHPEADTVIGTADAPVVERGGIAAVQVAKTLTREIYVAGRDDLALVLDADGNEVEAGIVYSGGTRAIVLWDAPDGPLTAVFHDGQSTTVQ